MFGFEDHQDSIVSPNIQHQFSDDSFLDFKEKRSLTESGTTLPWVYLGDSSTCKTDIVMTGFGLRDTSNFVVSGYVKVLANPNDCTQLTTTKQSGSAAKEYHNFVSSLSITTGDVQWYKSIGTSGTDNTVFKALTISTSNVLIVYYNQEAAESYQLRLVKLSISTGAFVQDLRITKGVKITGGVEPTYSMFGLFRNQLSISTGRNYLSFTGTYDSGKTTTGLLKFDETLARTWERVINFQVATGAHIVDMDFANDYNIALNYVNKQWLFMTFNETTGDTIHEMVVTDTGFTNNDLLDHHGVVRLQSNIFYAAIQSRDDPAKADTISLVSGTIKTSAGDVGKFDDSTIKQVQTEMLLKSPQLEVLIDAIIFSAIEIARPGENDEVESEILHVYYLKLSPTANLFKQSKHFKLQRGVKANANALDINLYMRYYTSATKATALYLAYNIQQYLNPDYKNRIVFFKVDPTKEPLTLDCAGTTSDFTTTQTMTFTAQAAQTAITNTDNLDTTNYNCWTIAITQTTAAEKLTVYDGQTSLTQLKIVDDLYMSPRSYRLSATSQGGVGFSADSNIGDTSKYLYKTTQVSTNNGLFRIVVNRCDGDTANQYDCKNLRYPNNTAVNLDVANKLSIISSGDVSSQNYIDARIKTYDNPLVKEYIGSKTFELVCYTQDGVESFQPHVRYSFVPQSTDALTHTAGVFDVASKCQTPIYPIYYGAGKDDQVTINHFGLGPTDNDMLVAGQSNIKPFSNGATLSKGFLSRLDSFGQPFWIYYIDNDNEAKSSNCFHASQSISSGLQTSLGSEQTIFGVCSVYNPEAKVQQGVLVGLSKLLGKVQLMKFLPRDYQSVDDEVKPFFVHETSDNNLIIGMEYKQIDPTDQYTFAMLKIKTTGEKIWYKKMKDFKQSSPIKALTMLTPSDGSILYTIVNGKDYALVYQVKLDVSNILGGAEFIYTHNPLTGKDSPKSIPYLTPDKASLYVPYYNKDTYKFSIISHDTSDMTVDLSTTIELSGNSAGTYNVQTASITLMPGADSTNIFHVILSGDIFIYIAFDDTLALITPGYKVWEYNGRGKGFYNLKGAFVLHTSLVFAASGQWNQATDKDSSLIIRLATPTSVSDFSNMNDFSCVMFRDIQSNEISDTLPNPVSGGKLFTIVVDVATAGTLAAGDPLVNIENAIYRQTEFMTEADAITLQTYSFSTPYNWGFNHIPDTYDFRVPALKQQCGSYSRQTDYSEPQFYQNNNDFGDYPSTPSYTGALNDKMGYIFDKHYLELTMGTIAYIDIAEPAETCQKRPMTVKVFSASANKIEQTWIKYDSVNKLLTINAGNAQVAATYPYDSGHTRLLMQDDLSVPEPGSYALVVRYEDTNDASTYYEHPLLIRVKPAIARTIQQLDTTECYQNPYPTSYGGCNIDNNKCKQYIYAFHYEADGVVRSNIYIGGSLQQDAAFMGYSLEDNDDAFIMKINDLAIPLWFTSFSFSRTTKDKITALTKVGDFIYAFITTGYDEMDSSYKSDYLYKKAYTAFLKVSAANGMLIEQKALNLYSKNGGAFYFDLVRHMQEVPKEITTGDHSTQFSMTFTYFTEKQNSQRVGSLRIEDPQTVANVAATDWSIVEFVSLKEQDNYEYTAGTTLYNGANPYYEAHFAKTKIANVPKNTLYYLKFDGTQTSSTLNLGFEVFMEPAGDFTRNSLSPKLTFDDIDDKNIYTSFFDTTTVYILKHNVTSSPETLELFSFTKLNDESNPQTDTFLNFDLLYVKKLNSFLCIVQAQKLTVDKGMIYFTIDRLTMELNSKIRYDNIPGAFTPNIISFYRESHDYFTYLRNVPDFANTGTNEILISRKALLYSDDNKYDCSPSSIYGEATTDMKLLKYKSNDCIADDITAIDSTADPDTDFVRLIDNSGTDLDTKNVIFKSDGYFIDSNNFKNSPYVSAIYMQDKELPLIFPQQGSNNAYYAGEASEKCSAGTGVQPPNTIDLAPITKKLGEAPYNKQIQSNTFQQCQKLTVEYKFLYEDGKNIQTADNMFAKFDSNYIQYDLQNFQPAPGFRLLGFETNTKNDLRAVKVAQPFIIKPKNYDAVAHNAPTDSKIYTCTADNDYPKVIGDIENDFTQNGADIDPKNGNTIICGFTKSEAYPNSYFRSDKDTAINIMTNLEGKIYWAFSLSNIKNDEQQTHSDLTYTQCSFDRQEFVYSLLHIIQEKTLVLVKQKYTYGEYVYSKQIPGTYDLNSLSGFVLIREFEIINDVSTLVQNYAYIFGSRSDSDMTNTLYHFSKFDILSEYPNQVWNAYQQIDGVTDSFGIQRMGASQDAVFAIYYLKKGTDQFAVIASYDAISGQSLATMAYKAQSLSSANTILPSLSFAVDESKNLIYLSSAHQTVTNTYTKYVRRFDLDLVPDDSIAFTVSTTNSDYQFVSDLAYDDTYLYEIFRFDINKYYYVSYLRQTTDVVAYKMFTQSDLILQNMFIRTFLNGNENWLLTFSTSKGFLTTSQYSSVIQKLLYKDDIINDPNSCLSNFYTDTLSEIPVKDKEDSETNQDTVVADINHFYKPSYYNLQPQLYLYWEQKLFPEQISFQSALNYQCSQPGLIFPEKLKHQTLRLPMNNGQEKIYSFPLPALCNPADLKVDISVDKYSVLPSFISGRVVNDWEGLFYRIVFANTITDANVGTYNVQIKLTLQSTQVSVADSFILHIYPQSSYGQNVKSFECQEKYNFMSFGGQVGNIYNHVDLDTKTGDYIICGANKLRNNDNTGYYSSFLQSITQGHAVQWHITLEAGEYDNIAQYCGITDELAGLDNKQIIVTVANSENFYQGQNNEKPQFNSSIYVFQHQRDAMFVNAKQIYNVDSSKQEYTLQAEGFFLNKPDGTIYINGIVGGFALSHNSEGFFVLKLDQYLKLQWYSVADYGRSPVGGPMLVLTSTVYTIFGYESDLVNSHRWGIAALDKTTGLMNQLEVTDANSNIIKYSPVTSLQNGTEISRNSSRKFYQQGFIYDSTDSVIYSCLIYKASEVHDEVAITQHQPTTLLPLKNIEFSRGYLPLETCEIQKKIDGHLVMALGTFEYTHVFAFKTNTTSFYNVTSLGLVYYHQRYIPFKIQMFERVTDPLNLKSSFSLFIRTNGFDLNEDQLFITKFTDVTKPEWDNPCTASEIQFNTTSTFYLSMNEYNGVGNNEMLSWSTLDYSFKQVQVHVFDQYYFKNPQLFTETVLTGENVVYRASFLNCSRYSNPTVPVDVLAADSPLQQLDATIKIGSNSYVYKFQPFTQCSYDEITHRVVYQDGTPIASFMVFDQDTQTLTITANLNDYAGTYLLRYEAFVDGDLSFVSKVDFKLKIDPNLPPYPVLNGFNEDAILYQSHTLRWTISLDYDVEGDSAIFDAFILDNTGTEIADPSWFKIISSNSSVLIIEAESQVVNVGNGDQYYINITVSDQYNEDTPNMYQINLIFKTDSAPVLVSTKSLTLGTVYVYQEFTFQLSASDFVDNENDSPIFSCVILSTSLDSSWIDEDDTTVPNTLIYSGKAPTNDLVGDYVFVCTVTDQYLPNFNYYQFRLKVIENKRIVTRDISPVSIVRTETYIYPDIEIACVDPENQPITRTITVIKTDTQSNIDINNANNGFTWEPATNYFAFAFTSVAQVGKYTIKMTCNDDFTEEQSVTFTLEAKDNQPPKAVLPIGTNWIFSSNEPTLISIDISGIFQDPEGDDLYLEVLNMDGTILDPSKITASIQNGQLLITLVDPNAQYIHELQLRATDPELQQTSTPFEIQVKACHETCKTCRDGGDTDCTSCQPDYVFYPHQCLLQCGFSTYLDDIDNECVDCPTGCLTCSGSSATHQCSECLAGFYLHTNDDGSTGCYNVCPTGYKIDDETQTCIVVGSSLYFDCITFIQNFQVTHPYVEDFSLMQSDTNTCSNMASGCKTQEDTDDGVCEWERKLAVQCRETADKKVMIRVATNSMPNHCMQPTTLFPDENNIDFEVQFSKPVTELTKTNLNTQALVDKQQCTLDWTASENLEAHSHVAIQGDVEGIVGIAINGVPIHSGTSELLYDYFAPKGTGPAVKRIEVDACLGSSEYKTFYHYYSFSPCMFVNAISNQVNAADCKSNSQCSKDYLKYALANLPTTQRVLSIVGIARDGHMIIGPYKASGVLWQPCDVDACNGVTVNGQYVYASTLFYPYTVACWGPASKQSSFAATCSNNAQTCFAGESFSIFLQFSSMLMLLIIALYLY